MSSLLKIVTKFGEISNQKKVLAVGGGLLMTGGIYYGLMLSPIVTEIDALKKEVVDFKDQAAKKSELAKNINIYQKEVELLDVKLKKALEELPDKKEMAQLLERISDKARSSGLEVRLFRPEPEVKKEFVAELPVTIDVAGTYHQIGTFFDEVARLERIVAIDSFALKNPKIIGEKVEIPASIVASSFRFLDDNERIQSENSAKTSTKRKGAAVEK